MAEFRITIAGKNRGPDPVRRQPSRLEILKAVLLGILGLAAVIGILLAAFVVGSIIASVLLVGVAVVLVVWLFRRLVSRLKRIFQI
jgi:hypothetical protein